MINILAQNVDFIISGTVCNNLAVYNVATVTSDRAAI